MTPYTDENNRKSSQRKVSTNTRLGVGGVISGRGGVRRDSITFNPASSPSPKKKKKVLQKKYAYEPHTPLYILNQTILQNDKTKTC